MPEKSSPVKVLTYHLEHAKKWTGDNQPFASLNQFANRAFGDLLTKLEEEQKKK